MANPEIEVPNCDGIKCTEELDNSNEYHCLHLYPISPIPRRWFRAHCNFVGPRLILKRHVAACHPKSFFLDESCLRKQYKGMETWYMMCFGQLFWCCCFYRHTGDVFFYNQLIAGPSGNREYSENKRYEIEVKLWDKSTKTGAMRRGCCQNYCYDDQWFILKIPSIEFDLNSTLQFRKKNFFTRRRSIQYHLTIMLVEPSTKHD